MSQVMTGVDVGGSSIKAGLVDIDTGTVVGEIIHEPTPQPSEPEAVLGAVGRLVARLPESHAIGFAMPVVVQRGKARTAANIDKRWIGLDGAALVERMLKKPAVFLNDADAAGLAEMTWGAGRGETGTVIMLTFGTGIGAALFSDGKLYPNGELGHVQMHGADAEEWVSARVRTEQKLDFPQWTARLNEYLTYIHSLLWPDLFILGGAVSERYSEFEPLLQVPTEVRPAKFAGQAGVIGAALAAARWA